MTNILVSAAVSAAVAAAIGSLAAKRRFAVTEQHVASMVEMCKKYVKEIADGYTRLLRETYDENWDFDDEEEF